MRRALPALVIALGLALGVGPADALPPQDAPETLRRALTLIDSAERGPETGKAGLVQATREVLLADPAVREQTWLAEPLSKWDFAAARGRIEAALAALQAGPSALPDSAPKLDRILSNPPFAKVDWVSRLPEWLQPLARPIADLLDLAAELLDDAGRALSRAVMQVIAWAMDSPATIPVSIAAIVAILLLYRAAFRSTLVRQVELAAAGGDVRPSAGQAFALAQQHAEARRYRDACHYLLVSTFLWLDEHERISFDPSATNREHLRRVPLPPELASVLSPMVSRFDRLWYGEAPAADEDYRELLALAMRVREVAA